MTNDEETSDRRSRTPAAGSASGGAPGCPPRALRNLKGSRATGVDCLRKPFVQHADPRAMSSSADRTEDPRQRQT